MTINFEPLNSSMVNGCAVEGENLLVRFANGAIYRYIGASGERTNLLTADSAGRYVNSMIKSNYQAERASEYEA